MVTSLQGNSDEYAKILQLLAAKQGSTPTLTRPMLYPYMGYGGSNGVRWADMTTKPTITLAEGDFKTIVDNLEGDAKTNFINKYAEGVTGGDFDYGGLAQNLGSLGMSIANMVISEDFSQKQYDLQNKHLDFEKELAEDYMELQKYALDVNADLTNDSQNAMIRLAELRVEALEIQESYESKTSIENTKTVAKYGYLNNKFYGKPASPTTTWVK